MKPKFSIIIPVYNAEKYLKECIDSVLCQTFKNFEVLCINDGSTDNSLNILNDYANKDCRIKVTTQNNAGQGAARNLAIKLAQGDYVIFIDNDDLIEPDLLEMVNVKIIKTNADIVEYNYNNYYVDKEKLIPDNRFIIHDIDIQHCISILDIKNCFFSFINKAAWCRAYNLNFLKENNIFFAEVKMFEDHIFVYKAIVLASKICIIDKPLYTWRVYSHWGKSSVYCAIFECEPKIREMLEKIGIYDDLKTQYEKYRIEAYAEHYCHIPDINRKEFNCKVRKIFNLKEYVVYLINIIKIKTNINSPLELIFSIKNDKNEINVKNIIILGKMLKIKKRKQIGG